MLPLPALLVVTNPELGEELLGEAEAAAAAAVLRDNFPEFAAVTRVPLLPAPAAPPSAPPAG